MALLKHRPRIQLFTPAALYAGQRFDAALHVAARRPLTVSGIEAVLMRLESVAPVGERPLAPRRPTRLATVRLADRCELPAGCSEYRCRFDLPAAAPPSYRGRATKTEYTVEVTVAIPWWRPASERFELRVELPPQAEEVQLLPRRFSSAPSGPRAHEPYLEGSVSSTNLTKGQRLAGAVAFGNVSYNTFVGATLALVGEEKVFASEGVREQRHEARRYAVDLQLKDPQEGEAFPFELKLPEDIPCSFSGEGWSLSWFFEVEAHLRWARGLSLRIPVTIVPPPLVESAEPEHPAPPSVGSARLRSIWGKVARQAGFSFDDDGRLRRTAGDVAIEVRREHRGRGGIFLVGELRYAELELQLTWDLQQAAIGGRDRRQVETMIDALLDMSTGVDCVAMDDVHLLVEQRDAGQRIRELREFCDLMVEQARRLERARARIPPPAVMRDALGSWRRLAQQLQGDLSTATMAVAGSWEGMPAEVVTRWRDDGEPLHTTVALRPVFAVDRRFLLGLFAEEGERYVQPRQLAAIRDRFPATVGVLLERLLPAARALAVLPDGLRVELDAPLADPQPVLRRFSLLAQLATQLRRAAGPYR